MMWQISSRNDGSLCQRIVCSVKTAKPASGYVSGIVRGWLFWTEQNTFLVVPVSIEDYCGSYAEWIEPELGKPIYTERPLKTRVSAQRAFVSWAQISFENRWQFRKA
jgi:hypothetical protein